MAKNKKITDLQNQNLTYFENGFTYTLLNLKKDKMVLDVAVYENGVFIKQETKPFAQIPKNLKTKINPL
ncbi:MAG: malate dehydrogenase [Candidatus Marinarcus sp.]|uniref:malate dehydrogenase n=1 Tax=Candidatus Marinarcus sp. TaxID=3100987 RepID=UPI003AFFE958